MKRKEKKMKGEKRVRKQDGSVRLDTTVVELL